MCSIEKFQVEPLKSKYPVAAAQICGGWYHGKHERYTSSGQGGKGRCFKMGPNNCSERRFGTGEVLKTGPFPLAADGVSSKWLVKRPVFLASNDNEEGGLAGRKGIW